MFSGAENVERVDEFFKIATEEKAIQLFLSNDHDDYNFYITIWWKL